MEGLTVTIERQTGERSTGFGTTEVADCGQYRVFVNGELVGYAPDEGQISIIKSGVSQPIMVYIKSEVEKLRNGKMATGIVQAPTFNEANVKLVEDSDDEEPLT